jgi:chromosome segregation ATPase
MKTQPWGGGVGRNGIFAAILCIASGAYAAPIDDYKELTREYQRQILHYLEFKQSFPAKETDAKEKVRLAYEDVLKTDSERVTALSQLKEFTSDLDSIPQQKKFLEQSISVAQSSIVKTLTEAQNSPEFSDGSKVTIELLNQRTSELSAQITQSQNQISQKQSQIREIEASATYLQLISRRNSARSHRDDLRIEEDRLSQLMGQRQGDVDSTRYQAQRAEQEAFDLRRRKDHIRRSITDLRQQNERARQNIEENDRKISRHTQELPTLDPQIAAVESRLAETRGRMAPLKAEVDTLQNEAQELRRQIKRSEDEKEKAELEQRLSEVSRQLEKKQGDLGAAQNQVRMIQAELENLRERRQALTRAIRRLEEENQSLENRIRSNRREIASLEQEYQPIDRDIDRAEQDSRRLWRRTEQLESELSRLSIERDAVSRRLVVANNELSQAESLIAQYRQQHIRPLETEIAQIRKSIGSLEVRLKTVNAWIARVQRQQQNIVQAQAKKATLDQERRQLEDSIVSTRTRVDQLTQALQQKQAVADLAKLELAQLRSLLNSKTQDYMKIEQQLVQLKKTI